MLEMVSLPSAMLFRPVHVEKLVLCLLKKKLALVFFSVVHLYRVLAGKAIPPLAPLES